MKKFASLLLTVVMLATMLSVFAVPASAQAQTIDGTDITWELTENDTGLTLTIGGEGEMPDFMFIDKTPWDDVAGNITAIEINSGVTSIGNNAFKGCTSLKELTIPGNVKRIGSTAFSGCSGIATLTISEGVTSIEMGAFSGFGSLQKVTIPGTVTSIGSNAFSACIFLKEVTIPASVTSIGTEAFVGCPNLVIHGTSGTAAEQYAKDYGVGFFVDGECKHVGRLVCETCQAHLTGSQLLQAWEGDNFPPPPPSPRAAS